MKAIATKFKLRELRERDATEKIRPDRQVTTLNRHKSGNEMLPARSAIIIVTRLERGCALAISQATGAIQTDKEQGSPRSGRSLQLILPEKGGGDAL